MNETGLAWIGLAICIASLVLVFGANHRRNHKAKDKFEKDYNVSYHQDSVTVMDNKRKVGTVHYTKLDSLICGDNQ